MVRNIDRGALFTGDHCLGHPGYLLLLPAANSANSFCRRVSTGYPGYPNLCAPQAMGHRPCDGLFYRCPGGWFSMEPSNSRDWQPDVAVLPHATISGNMVTVHNIRNCNYRSETDYTVDHYDRTFDVSEMTSVDLYMVDWGIGYIVHTMMSFGFEEEQYLCISIETRKEKGENYSTVKGFFRQYESFYVVADERDVVRLRTNYRKGETVYLYRLIGSSLDVGREVFLDYMRYINHLKEKPEWYNALTGNCTTQIRGRARPYAENARWDWRFLANGYIDTMAYERGIFDQTFSLEELKRRSIINARAREVDSDTEFSKLIRRGLPGMSQ